MASHKPTDNHPWRRYKNKPEQGELALAAKNAPSLKNFLKTLVENWETYNIPIDEEEYTKIKSVSDEKAAVWLSHFLKKTWSKEKVPTTYV